MDELNAIFAAIAASGFSEETLQEIDDLTNDILYGRKDFNGFTLSEHAGLCKGGAPLIGASIVVSYARRSLTTGSNAESSTGSCPANWQIDEAAHGVCCVNITLPARTRRHHLAFWPRLCLRDMISREKYV